MSPSLPQAPSHVRAFDHVRALSAFAVVVHHIEQAKALLGLPGVWLAPWVQSLGSGGVDVFFGLSGYVITQSLLAERARGQGTGTLLGRFYTRRGLRILPLYFALVVVAFSPLTALLATADSQVAQVLEAPLQGRDGSYGTLLMLHLLGLPNAALAGWPGVPFATHLWSVGAEMQFYLVWPLFFVATRQVWTAAALAAAATVAVAWVLPHAGSALGLASRTIDIAAQTLGTIHGRYLLAGIGAAAVVAGPAASWRGRVPPAVHWGALVAIAALLPGRHLLPASAWASPVVLAAALAGLALAARPAPARTSAADHLGRISYSVYVWHVLVIGVVALVLDLTLGLEPWRSAVHVALYAGVVAVTIAVATASFHVIEQPFLRLAAQRRQAAPGR